MLIAVHRSLENLLPLLVATAVVFSSLCIHAMSIKTPTTTRRGLVSTPIGMIHYVSIGEDSNDSSPPPLVAFHLSPRSVDEYKEVMEEVADCGSKQLFIAMDEPGYGQSDIPKRSCTLDEIADAFLAVLDSLQVQTCITVGSLMGNYFALSLASRYPNRVKGVVCTNLYYFPDSVKEKSLQDQKERQQQEDKNQPIKDPWILQDDGSHISEIWNKRSSWLTSELNTRATYDELTYNLKRRVRYSQGIYIQDGSTFDLVGKCQSITCPVLSIQGIAATKFFDTIGYDMTGQYEKAIKLFTQTTPQQETLSGSLNLMNENAQEWWTLVNKFVQQSNCS